MFRECSESVKRVLRECSESVQRVFRECLESVKRVLRECSESVQRVFTLKCSNSTDSPFLLLPCLVSIKILNVLAHSNRT